MVDSPQVNAFVVPGGKVVVYTGWNRGRDGGACVQLNVLRRGCPTASACWQGRLACRHLGRAAAGAVLLCVRAPRGHGLAVVPKPLCRSALCQS